MTIDQYVSIASSIGTVLAATIALFTLLEMRAQRKRSHQPDIIVDKKVFEQIPDPTSSNTSLWVEKINSSLNPMKGQNVFKKFSLRIINVGLGTARNIEIEWDFDIKKIIETINSIEVDNKILLSKGFLEANEGKTLVSTKNHFKKTDFILPFSSENNVFECIVPLAYIYLVSTLYKKHSFEGNGKSTISAFKFPKLHLEIKYSNIENDKFKRTFDIEIDPIMYTKDHFVAEIKPDLLTK